MRITNLRLISLFFLTILFLQGVHAQNTSVRGLVTDAKGEALIGVNVTEVGNTNNGAITDINGVFTLSVPSQGQIQVSYLGYKTEVVNVNNRTNITRSGTSFGTPMDAYVPNNRCYRKYFCR